jgi:hypothetical protein
MSATTVPWSDFVLEEYGFHRYRREDTRQQERERLEKQHKRNRHDRQRKILKSFYGAGLEITLHEFPGFTPFAKIVAPTGTRADITAKRISLSSDIRGVHPMHDHHAMIASTLLAEAIWGRVKVDGRKDFQMRAVAYGVALGAHVTAMRQDQFTGKDVRGINELAAKLRQRGIHPAHPGRRPGQSVSLWPEPTT